jgi:hypothetical protein
LEEQMSEFDYEGAINNLADSTDIDPDRLKDAYQGREGLLKERFSSKEAGAGVGAAGAVGSVLSAVVLVKDAAQAAYSHDNAKLPTTSAGIFLVSAFLLAAGAKAMSGAWRSVKKDAEKYAPVSGSSWQPGMNHRG